MKTEKQSATMVTQTWNSWYPTWLSAYDLTWFTLAPHMIQDVLRHLYKKNMVSKLNKQKYHSHPHQHQIITKAIQFTYKSTDTMRNSSNFCGISQIEYWWYYWLLQITKTKCKNKHRNLRKSRKHKTPASDKIQGQKGPRDCFLYNIPCTQG
jgi:hypothetical protein